jgi:hypothetical protein
MNLPARSACTLYVLLLPLAGHSQVGKLLADPPVLVNDRLVQPIHLVTEKKDTLVFTHALFRFETATDSQLVFRLKSDPWPVQAGVQSVQLPVVCQPGKCNQTYLDIFTRYNLVPPGNYKMYTTVRHRNDTSVLQSNMVQLNTDSALDVNSNLFYQFNAGLLKEVKHSASLNMADEQQLSPARIQTAATNAIDRLNRSRKIKGLDVQYHTNGGVVQCDLFYRGVFLGSSRNEAAQLTGNRIKNKVKTMQESAGGMLKNNLQDVTTLSTQLQKSNGTHKQEKLYGNIEISSHNSTGQEQYSQYSNNYYELEGEAHVKLFDIPITVEGYLNTQDFKRTIKSSYFRVNYDLERAKQDLLKKTNTFREKYSQSQARFTGLSSIYQSYLGKLGQEQQGILREMNMAGIDQETITGLGGQTIDSARWMATLKDKALQKADSGGKIAGTVQEAGEKYAQLYRKYERLQQIQQLVLQYRALLEQNRTAQYFDSALVYGKIKDYTHADDLSYRQLATKAGELLPRNGVIRYLKGLQSFDAGIFNHYTSKYTLNGQTTKGLSVGYDFGAVETRLSYGRTEYVSRSGITDQYSTYSLRVASPELGHQKFGAVYYGYSPSKGMMGSNSFFKDVDVALPGFKQTAHIVSMFYEGRIGHWLQYSWDAARSFKAENTEAADVARPNPWSYWAFNGNLAYSPARLPVTFDAEWEKVGNRFENMSLPVMMNGIQRYALGGSALLFRGFLSAKLQYNLLEQQNYAMTATSRKWAAELRTNSKRYPSVYLSYKPMSTFRAADDTLAVSQRPMLGEVWIVRGSYQFKREGRSHRFTLTWNRNKTDMDTLHYESRMMQAGYNLTTAVLNYNLQLAYNRQPEMVNIYGIRLPSETYMCNQNLSAPLSKTVSGNVSGDISFNGAGLLRYGLSMGLSKRIPKRGLTLRMAVRGVNYKDISTEIWKPLAGLDLSVRYQFNEMIGRIGF